MINLLDLESSLTNLSKCIVGVLAPNAVKAAGFGLCQAARLPLLRI